MDQAKKRWWSGACTVQAETCAASYEGARLVQDLSHLGTRPNRAQVLGWLYLSPATGHRGALWWQRGYEFRKREGRGHGRERAALMVSIHLKRKKETEWSVQLKKLEEAVKVKVQCYASKQANLDETDALLEIISQILSRYSLTLDKVAVVRSGSTQRWK